MTVARWVAYRLAWDHMIGLHLLGARLKGMNNVFIRIPYITIFDGAIATLASLSFKLRFCTVDRLVLLRVQQSGEASFGYDGRWL